MKKAIFLISFFILIISCKDEITVFIEKEPGSITGQVLPKDVNASVELYQGSLIKKEQVDRDGIFIFRDIPAGSYTLRAKTPNFGSTENLRVHVSESEGYDVGIIELSVYPYPLAYIIPHNGAKQVDIRSTNRLITMNFYETMNIESVQNAFTIIPAVENLVFTTYPPPNPRFSSHCFYIGGNFQTGTQYTFTIDSTAHTIYDEPLEFSYSSSFETDHFKVANFYIPQNIYGDYQILFYFNSQVNSLTFLENLTIEPSIEVITWNEIDDRMKIRPALSWIPDTTFNLIISGDLPDINGNTLQGDTSFSFYIQPLQISSTNPYPNQHFVPTYQRIQIRMNNLLDEGSIQEAVSLYPDVNFDISTNVSGGMTYFYINPDSLMSQTEYTVTIDTSLKDYYGGNFKENYSFNFVTQ